MQTVRFNEIYETKEQTGENLDQSPIQCGSHTQADSSASTSLPKSAPTTKDLDQVTSSSPKDTQPKFQNPKTPHVAFRSAGQPRVFEPPAKRHFVFRPSSPCWLIVSNSQRHISLPATGTIFLGRFDPNEKSRLDVDLTFEDSEPRSISRRHARIMGHQGFHTIEDMGSNNGLFVNGARLEPGYDHPLQPGDHVMLGELEMRYMPVSDEFLNVSDGTATSMHRFLLLAYNGRKITIEPPNEVMIGRADPAANVLPHLDLSQEGEVAASVSRRHAIVTWCNHQPYIKDIGSSCGTRLNGQLLARNQLAALKPGDHISLGGCVLVYDVEKIQKDYLPPRIEVIDHRLCIDEQLC